MDLNTGARRHREAPRASKNSKISADQFIFKNNKLSLFDEDSLIKVRRPIAQTIMIMTIICFKV
jgi:hypothetical protein